MHRYQNGCTTALTTQTTTIHDGENRPVSVTHNLATTTYECSPDGARVKKLSGGQTTFWLGADYEIQPDGTIVRHLHPDVRTARDPLTGTNELSVRRRDHLASVKLITDVEGIHATRRASPQTREAPPGGLRAPRTSDRAATDVAGLMEADATAWRGSTICQFSEYLYISMTYMRVHP